MIPANLLPEPYQQTAFIAGGWAACPSLASDMDVWIPVPSPHVSLPEPNDLRVIVHLTQVRDEVLRHLRANSAHYAVQEEMETRNAESSMYRGINCTILKVGIVHKHGYWNDPIHILVTDAPDVAVLLSSFDISTHRVAITNIGVVRGEDWTPISVPPVALRANEHTPARMSKVAERYGHGTKV